MLFKRFYNHDAHEYFHGTIYNIRPADLLIMLGIDNLSAFQDHYYNLATSELELVLVYQYTDFL